MKKITFELDSEFIELIKLLKVLDIAQSGGHAKHIVDSEVVFVNGEKELRKRRKLKIGDTIELFENFIVLSPPK
jgi:ribosome-associated protein